MGGAHGRRGVVAAEAPVNIVFDSVEIRGFGSFAPNRTVTYPLRRSVGLHSFAPIRALDHRSDSEWARPWRRGRPQRI